MDNFLDEASAELMTSDISDPILRCGSEAMKLVIDQPEIAIELADKKLHVFPFKDVDVCWRRLYTDGSINKAILITRKHLKDDVQRDGPWLDEVVKVLDMALIMTGAPRRESVIETFLTKLQALADEDDHPRKRRKIDQSFPPNDFRAPEIEFPIPRSRMSLSSFENQLSNPSPIVIRDAISHWPALNERPWNNPSYFLRKTLNGRRLIPVELGRSYTDDGWGQTIIPFKDFMNKYLLQSYRANSPFPCKGPPRGTITEEAKDSPPENQIAYLAQHDLFAQIPSLRADVSIPDFCYTTPPPASQPQPPLSEPLLNAWFGPAGTISPLHTDPYHNILCQVVGKKYVRLYAPSEGDKLYPRGMEGEKGKEVDMSNTSGVPVEMVEMDMGEHEDEFVRFGDAKYVETILGEGECLYIPVGWWHYVRSLTVSFSVSFWWN